MSQPSKHKYFVHLFSPVTVGAIGGFLGILTLGATLLVVSDSAVSAVQLTNEISAEIDGGYYVSISAADTSMSLAPATSGTNTTSTTTTVTASTNASSDIDLYLNMGSSSSALFLDGDLQSTNKINSTTKVSSLTRLDANTWGYSLDGINYQGVPTANSDAALIGNLTKNEADEAAATDVSVYYGMKVDDTLKPGRYANRLVYSAVVDGAMITKAVLDYIEIDGEKVEELTAEKENTIVVQTNLMTNMYGESRAFIKTTSPEGYQECSSVSVGKSDEGYLTLTCKITPSAAATEVSLEVVAKGSEGDIFCSNGNYVVGSSDCEGGTWRWGEVSVVLPAIRIDPMSIENMQDMTADICAAWEEHATKQLIDVRDGQKYWVAKLKDGNCWMTQNLNLDLEGITLTPEDSDVFANWTPNITTLTAGNASASASSTTVQSWDLGDYVIKSTTATPSSYCSPTDNLSNSACANYVQSIEGLEPMTEVRTDSVIIEDNAYDAHFTVGNYYTWNAATAGTGGTMSSGTASSSICPAGWKLPTSGNNTTNGTFGYMLTQYGVQNSPTSGSNNIAAHPLYFVRSGYVYPGRYLSDAGRLGRYWSRTAYSSACAHYLYFYESGVNPSDKYFNKHYGFSMRCILAD
ncbi:MAG: hypothetical protein ACLRJC_12270 [Emergencia timonensis]